MRRWSRQHEERGAIAVELVIIMPILAVLLFGIIEFGIALSKYEVYLSAAREGARYAAVRCQPGGPGGCTDALIASKVSSSAVGYPIGPGSPHESIVCSSTTVGQNVTVSWEQDIAVSIPFFGNLTFTPTMQAVFRCE